MFSKIVRKFSTLQPAPKGKFNIFSSLQNLKNAVRAPVKHFKRLSEPSGVNYSPMTNTTEEAFDEVSQEWQALIVGNAYDVNTFNYLEAVSQGNFGTVDNPHVIFTSDAPYRYVGCTGQANEDDYEGHEILYFMLKEGPLQRCPSCGQVWKLVRLRNEFSPEMDYYLSNFLPYEVQEMAEMDTTTFMSPRFNVYYEYSQFETPSNRVFHLVNPDEHDKLLTDPAYRLEKTKQLHDKLKIFLYSLKQVDREWTDKFGPLPRHPINPVDYITLIEAEKAIMKLDRLFRKVDKFNNRKYIDSENHERREKRMKERSAARWDNNYTFFYGDLSEEEQQYRDYYQTDVERFPEDEKVEEELDTQEILTRGDYNLEKYDFQESFTRAAEDDQSSLLEKMAFQFRFRMASDKADVYQKRNQRMIDRHLKRFADAKIQDVLNLYYQAIDSNDAQLEARAKSRYFDFVSKEAIQQYKDYYEDDSSKDLSVLDNISGRSLESFIVAFENHTQSKLDQSGFKTFPKRQWNPAFGLWKNFFLDFQDFNTQIAPKARVLSNQAQNLQLGPAELQSLAGEQKAKIEQKK